MVIYIGCSGWHYRHWVGPLYPEGMKPIDWLPCYAQHFSSVEINATFYSLPTGQTVRRWQESTPQDFRFVVKGSQIITHRKLLADTDEDAAILYARIAPLSEKLLAVLWQFPPSFARDQQSFRALEHFCRGLVRYGYPCVFEFRDDSWLHTDVAALLAECGFGYVTADHPRFYLERAIPRTGSLLYIRMHGLNGDHAALYRESEMQSLAETIVTHQDDPALEKTLVFFNNDITASAITNARTLQHLLQDRLPGCQPGWSPGLCQPMLPGVQPDSQCRRTERAAR